MYINNTPILSKRYTPSNGLVTRLTILAFYKSLKCPHFKLYSAIING